MTKNKNWTAKRTQNTGASKASLRATNARIDRINAKIRKFHPREISVKTLGKDKEGDVN